MFDVVVRRPPQLLEGAIEQNPDNPGFEGAREFMGSDSRSRCRGGTVVASTRDIAARCESSNLQGESSRVENRNARNKLHSTILTRP